MNATDGMKATGIDGNKLEKITRMFHESYERLAPIYQYKTREATAVPWDKVPLANKQLMLQTVLESIGPEIESRDKRIAELEYRHRELLDAFAKHLECGPLDGMDLHEAEETVANNYFLRMTQACELRDSLLKRAEQAEADAAAMREALEWVGDAIADETIISGPKNGQGSRYAISVSAKVILVLDGTAGRDLLDELKRLREQNCNLMDGIANICADSEPDENGPYGPTLYRVREALKQLASEVSK